MLQTYPYPSIVNRTRHKYRSPHRRAVKRLKLWASRSKLSLRAYMRNLADEDPAAAAWLKIKGAA